MLLIDRTRVRKENLKAAESGLLAAVHRHFKLDDEENYKVRLVVAELLNNIICHSDADTIEMRCYADSDRLEIRIDDNGSGFSYHDFMNHDVTKGADLWGQGGRGIFLVKNLAEEFTYNERGNSVRVVLQLKGEAQPARP